MGLRNLLAQKCSENPKQTGTYLHCQSPRSHRRWDPVSCSSHYILLCSSKSFSAGPSSKGIQPRGSLVGYGFQPCSAGQFRAPEILLSPKVESFTRTNANSSPSTTTTSSVRNLDFPALSFFHPTSTVSLRTHPMAPIFDNVFSDPASCFAPLNVYFSSPFSQNFF